MCVHVCACVCGRRTCDACAVVSWGVQELVLSSMVFAVKQLHEAFMRIAGEVAALTHSAMRLGQ
jgi:hypothetical protein